MEPIHFRNVIIINAQPMASNITSVQFATEPDINEEVSYSVQATWTGSPVGTLKLQASNNIALLGWTDITSSVVAVNGPGTYLINIERHAYSFVQMVYVATSGSGTLSAVYNSKRD